MLDAWALLALLRNEPAAPMVRDRIARGGAGMSWINVGEAHYLETRRRDEQGARTAIEALRPALHLEAPDEAMVIAAARLKADHPISYADCFAVATAQRHRAPLLTGDPELVALPEEVEVIDLRRAR